MSDIIAFISNKTIAGYILGLATAVLISSLNYLFNKKIESNKKRDNILSISCAIYGEVFVLRNEIAKLTNKISYRYQEWGTGSVRYPHPFDEKFIEWIGMPKIKLYTEIIKDIGIMPSDLSLEVVKFYSYFDELKSWLPKLVRDPDLNYTYSINYFLDPAISAIDSADKIMKSIDIMKRKNNSEKLIDIKLARTIQSMANEY